MGLYDRDYTKADYQSDAPQMRIAFPKLSPVVKWLLIINGVVFALTAIPSIRVFVFNWFSVFPVNLSISLQLWRLITYQFLHGSASHILFNMLGLFFLGPTLERYWNSKKFLIFYLGCGIAGGICYTLLASIKFLSVGPMVGASGAILGMLAACAILFPHFVVFIIVFPVPIRIAAIGLTGWYLFTVLTGGANAGGDAAHLAGMAAGAIYVISQSWRTKLKLRIQHSAWEKKITEARDLQVELDRILEKVHDSGIHSLTSKEKKILRQATEAERLRSKL